MGNIPLPTTGAAERAVNQAADEIDAAIGFKYKTPVLATGANQRAVAMLMQNINIWLATGRLIQELTAAREEQQIHAYALGLVNEAMATIKMIVTGEIILEGVPPVSNTETPQNAPFILNVDDESNVEAFYDRIANPLAVAQGDAWPYYLYGSPTGSAVYRG